MNFDVEVQLQGDFFGRGTAELGLNENFRRILFPEPADQLDKIFRFRGFPPRLNRHLPQAELGAIVTVGRVENTESPGSERGEPLGGRPFQRLGGLFEPFGPLRVAGRIFGKETGERFSDRIGHRF